MSAVEGLGASVLITLVPGPVLPPPNLQDTIEGKDVPKRAWEPRMYFALPVAFPVSFSVKLMNAEGVATSIVTGNDGASNAWR